MNQNYIIFLLIFILFLYIVNERKTNKHSKIKRNDFVDTRNTSNKLNEIDYVKTKVNNLYDNLIKQRIYCSSNLNKNTNNCKYGSQYEPILNDMTVFLNDLNQYSISNYKSIDEKYNEIEDEIEKLKNTDNNVEDDFDNTMKRLLEQQNKDSILKPSTILTHSPNLDGFMNTEDFNNLYAIIPYQYKNFNNIQMILDTQNNLNTLRFYLATLDNIKLLVTYEIDNINFVNNTILDKLEGSNKPSNGEINGIKFRIKRKELSIENSEILKKIIQVLDNLGLRENKTFYLFLSNDDYDKVLYNYNKNGFYGENEEKYYKRSDKQVYRLYNEFSKSLLNMIKTQD